MLTVWCVCVGDKYSTNEILLLKKLVERNLSKKHRFVCITDRSVDGVETLAPPTDYPGWWSKIGLFKPGVATNTSLYLDLDVVITGSLNVLVDHYKHCTLAMAWNWAKSGHGGCQSSVMVWRGNCAHQIYADFDPANAHWPPINRPGILWGDQEMITKLRDSGKLLVTQIRKEFIKSYKYHCQDSLPEQCRVVVFHGDPKPGQVTDRWVAEARR